jgi:hypothetical protein
MKVLLRIFYSFLNRWRHFISLAVANSNGPVAITYNDQRGEAETATALNNFRAAKNFHYRIFQRLLTLYSRPDWFFRQILSPKLL